MGIIRFFLSKFFTSPAQPAAHTIEITVSFLQHPRHFFLESAVNLYRLTYTPEEQVVQDAIRTNLTTFFTNVLTDYFEDYPSLQPKEGVTTVHITIQPLMRPPESLRQITQTAFTSSFHPIAYGSEREALTFVLDSIVSTLFYQPPSLYPASFQHIQSFLHLVFLKECDRVFASTTTAAQPVQIHWTDGRKE